MFQGSEIIVIFLVALVVLGPERLPALARTLGKWTSELRKAASELKAGLESEIGDVKGLVDEVKAPIEEIKKVAKDTTRSAREIADDVKEETKWVGPKPISGPTPEDAMRDLEAIEANTPEPPADESQSDAREGGPDESDEPPTEAAG